MRQLDTCSTSNSSRQSRRQRSERDEFAHAPGSPGPATRRPSQYGPKSSAMIGYWYHNTMTKVISLRLDDHVAALVAERSKRHQVSLNQEINDALLRDAENDVEHVRERARQNMEQYRTVMERLA